MIELLIAHAVVIGIVVFLIGFYVGKLHAAYEESERRRIANNKRVWTKAKKEGRISVGLSGRPMIIPPYHKELVRQFSSPAISKEAS